MPEVVLAGRTISGTYTATVRIDYSKISPDEFAGLAAYGWRRDAVGISLGAGRIFSWWRGAGKQTEPASIPLPAGANSVLIRLTAETGEIFRFFFSRDEGRTWSPVGDRIIATNVEGARIALVYRGEKTIPGIKFDWLRVE
jgi:hypothetical protein